MGNPIATTAGGICFAFPNVCLTPAPPGPDVPIPYPSIGQLRAAEDFATDVKAGGSNVIIKTSKIKDTTGDSAGTSGGVISGSFGKEVEFTTASTTVFANGEGVVRMFDSTKQNKGNANGQVLGGFAQVLVGG